MHLKHCLHSALAHTSRQLVHSPGICQSVCGSQSSRGWQEGQQMVLLSVSGGQSAQQSMLLLLLLLQLTPPLSIFPYSL